MGGLRRGSTTGKTILQLSKKFRGGLPHKVKHTKGARGARRGGGARTYAQ